MTRDDVMVLLSTALFKSWFPNGHGGAYNVELQEDFDNWVECAMADAEVAIDTLIEAGLLSVSDSAKVDETTKDERR